MLPLLKDVLNFRRAKCIWIAVLTFLSSVTSGAGILMLVPLMNFLNIESESTAGSLAFISQLMSGMSRQTRLLVLLGVYVAIITIKAIITRVVAIKNTELAQSYAKHIREGLYNSVMGADTQRFAEYKHTDLLNSFTTETARVGHAVTLITQLLSLVLTALVQICAAFVLNVPLTLVVLAVGGVFSVCLMSITSKSRKNGESLRLANQSFLGEVSEQMSGIKEIKSYGIEAESADRFRQAAENYEKEYVRFSRLFSKPQLLHSIGAAGVLAIVFFISSTFLHTAATELIVIAYIFARLWPIYSSAQSAIMNILAAVPSFINIERTTFMMSREAKQKNPVESNDRFTLTDCIHFDNVEFAYNNKEERTLRNITLTIKANSVTAIIGKSGAGKSTVINLLMGFLMPKSGDITVDGVPLNMIDAKKWRGAVGYVAQDPLILNATIRENILRFHPNADENTVITALKRANAFSFVEGLPKGLDTIVGDRGVMLSGGERQRIVLARALAGNPKLLILDEATSALDNENERSICDTVTELSSSVTVVVVAHRLETISRADSIIVIDNGEVVEEGTFAKLSSRADGYIAKMRNTINI